MQVEAEFLYDYSKERDDLLVKKHCFGNSRFGKRFYYLLMWPTIFACTLKVKDFLRRKKLWQTQC